jgi:hypothetical protein
MDALADALFSEVGAWKPQLSSLASCVIQFAEIIAGHVMSVDGIQLPYSCLLSSHFPVSSSPVVVCNRQSPAVRRIPKLSIRALPCSEVENVLSSHEKVLRRAKV